MKRLAKYLVTCLFLSIFAHLTCSAVPAYRSKVRIAVEGGEVYIQLRGDESYSYAVTEDGYTIFRDSIGWLYAKEDKDGNIVPSEYRLVHKSRESAALRDFLRTTEKSLLPSRIVHTANSGQVKTVPHTRATGNVQPVIGERRALIILVQFRDLRFSKGVDDFEALFNEEGYNKGGAIGSVYDFYKEMSYGQLSLKADIIGPYTSRNDMDYYGGNSSYTGGDRNPMALFEEALSYAQSVVNLADYDADKDGYVDNIHLIFAGYGEEAGAPANTIWSHEMTFYPLITAQSVYVNKYSCSPELRGNRGDALTHIGVICHEIGHALGAMDYYDTDYEQGGNYLGTGEWDLMAEGSWNGDGANPGGFNPYVKINNFGWINPKVVLEGGSIVESTYEMLPGDILCIVPQSGNDYFYAENVRRTGTFYPIRGEGLMIYHIGGNIEQKSVSNTINVTFPQECYPVCASSNSSYPSNTPSSYGDINSLGCPYPGSTGNTTFSKESKPSAVNSKKEYIGVSLIDISEDAQGNVTFTATNEDSQGGQYQCLWCDDFESNNMADRWTQETITGKGAWALKNELYNDNGGNNGYLVLQSAGSASSLKRDPLVVRLQSEVINVNADCDSLLLELEFKHTHKLYQKEDYITFQVLNSANELLESKQITLTEDCDWTKLQMQFCYSEKIQLLIESDMDTRSKLYIDNVSLLMSSDIHTDLETPFSAGDILQINGTDYVIPSGSIVYNAIGMRVCTVDSGAPKVITLSPGLYIVSDGRKSVKIAVR